MFAIVADIERYPEFLPWCEKLTVRGRERADASEIVIADMVIGFHGLRERYTSRVEANAGARTIVARHLEGPFRHLDTDWSFRPLETGSEVQLKIDFAFSNPFLSALADRAFGFAASRMADAFVRRAEALYGSGER